MRLIKKGGASRVSLTLIFCFSLTGLAVKKLLPDGHQVLFAGF